MKKNNLKQPPKKALRKGLTSRVAATLSQSRLTDATPNAVLTNIGQTEQIKMTKMPEMEESLMVYSANGIQAKGLMGLST